MEPTLPEDPELRGIAADVARAAESLGRNLHPGTLAAVRELLRTVNCYYSNLIEGHDTHPVEIEQAMRGDYAPGSVRRNLQLEAKAHIDVQLLLEEELAVHPDINVCATDLVLRIHREFYERLPSEFRIVRDPSAAREEPVMPGAVRHYDVRVGEHVAPPFPEITPLLERFATVYNPAGRTPAEGLVVLGAAHHRLLWIHPFGDGNGRVTRLMTELYLRRLGIASAGLWAVSRGLARRSHDYKAALAAADAARWNDVDGRGPLSHRALVAFCRFFLDVAIDQVKYMSGLLRADDLATHATNYGKSREAGILIPGGAIGAPHSWGPDATKLLTDLVYRGTIARGAIVKLLTMPERSARRVVRLLTDEGFISSSTSRAPLQLRIPAHAAPYLFPGLYHPR